jgi:GntR family transcriptional regulator
MKSISERRDSNDSLPLYVRIASSLRARVAAGEWKEGDKLPPFNALAQEYGVATITLRTAVGLLREEGALSSTRGRGTRVTSGRIATTRDTLRSIINAQHELPPHHAISVLSRTECSRLPDALLQSYNPAQGYMHLMKVHSYQGEPYAAVNIYIDRNIYALFPTGAEERAYVVNLLRDIGRVDVIRSRHEITVVHSDPEISGLLQCSLATQLVRVRRWKLSSSDTLVYASTVLYRPELFVWDVTESSHDYDHFRIGIERSST